jgi:hypothetical protein
MNRAVIYRGISAKERPGFEKFWLKGDLVKNGDRYFIHPQANTFSQKPNSDLTDLVVMHEIIPETIGVYTGIDDINQKPIFEGDIVKDRDTQERGVIKFGEWEKGYGFYIDWEKNFFNNYLRKDIYYWCIETQGLEVTGDIHTSVKEEQRT